MALSPGSLCLGVPWLLSPSSLRTVFRCPRLALCTVGNPSPSSMGRSQSQVIGEVVAPVALLSGIALSPGSRFRYGRHRRKAVILFRSPSLLLLGVGYTPPSSSPTVSSGGHVTANRQFCGSPPPHTPPGLCFLTIGWSILSWLRAWQVGWL